MKSSLCTLLWAVYLCHVFVAARPVARPVTRRLKATAAPAATRPPERRLNFDDELQTGSLYVQQMENTNSNLNEMSGHSRLQNTMKKVGQLFGDIEERLDDFRDSVARKLNELHMSLQRPKVPIMGPAAMMLHPSMNPVLSSTLNSSNGGFMPAAASMLGPAVTSMYNSPLLSGSNFSNAALPSRMSPIVSQQLAEVPPAQNRMLFNQPAGVNVPGVL